MWRPLHRGIIATWSSVGVFRLTALVAVRRQADVDGRRVRGRSRPPGYVSTTAATDRLPARSRCCRTSVGNRLARVARSVFWRSRLHARCNPRCGRRRPRRHFQRGVCRVWHTSRSVAGRDAARCRPRSPRDAGGSGDGHRAAADSSGPRGAVHRPPSLEYRSRRRLSPIDRPQIGPDAFNGAVLLPKTILASATRPRGLLDCGCGRRETLRFVQAVAGSSGRGPRGRRRRRCARAVSAATSPRELIDALFNVAVSAEPGRWPCLRWVRGWVRPSRHDGVPNRMRPARTAAIVRRNAVATAATALRMATRRADAVVRATAAAATTAIAAATAATAGTVVTARIPVATAIAAAAAIATATDSSGEKGRCRTECTVTRRTQAARTELTV